MIIGFPGVLFGVLAFMLREPVRETRTDVPAASASSSSWKKLITNRAFVLLCVGYALLGLATNNLSIWGATFYSRLHGFDLPTIGFWGGILTLAAGIPATLFGGAIADWFHVRGYGRMLFGSLLALVSIPFWLLMIFSGNVYAILLANFVLLAAALSWLGAAAADATEIAGVQMRGLAIAIYFFSVNIAAYLIGSNLIGFLSDRLGASQAPQMMRYSLLVCPAACVLSSICLFVGSRISRRES
jgi:MFS family permease